MNSEHIEISGHRGCRRPEIENTAAAFQYCIDNNIDWVEFDVKTTQDNEVVIFHDKSVKRLLSGKGNIESLTLEELRRMKYEDGQGIQTLEEFFTQIHGKTKPMLEIKSRGIGSAVIKLVRKFEMAPENLIIQSFVGKDILECYAIAPEYQYGKCISVHGNIGILGKLGRMQSWIAEKMYKRIVEPFPIDWLNIDGPFAYDEFMRLCTDDGKKIILGAMTPESYFKKLADWDVRIINSDTPVATRKRLQEFLEK